MQIATIPSVTPARGLANDTQGAPNDQGNSEFGKMFDNGENAPRARQEPRERAPESAAKETPKQERPAPKEAQSKAEAEKSTRSEEKTGTGAAQDAAADPQSPEDAEFDAVVAVEVPAAAEEPATPRKAGLPGETQTAFSSTVSAVPAQPVEGGEDAAEASLLGAASASEGRTRKGLPDAVALVASDRSATKSEAPRPETAQTLVKADAISRTKAEDTGETPKTEAPIDHALRKTESSQTSNDRRSVQASSEIKPANPQTPGNASAGDTAEIRAHSETSRNTEKFGPAPQAAAIAHTVVAGGREAARDLRAGEVAVRRAGIETAEIADGPGWGHKAGDRAKAETAVARFQSVAIGANGAQSKFQSSTADLVATPNELQEPLPVETGQLEQRLATDATARAEQAVNRHETPRPVMQQVAEAARALRDGPVELTLKPEELGAVKLTLSASDGAMNLIVATERPETLDLLRRNIDELARDLRELGFENLNFSFQQDRAPQQQIPTWEGESAERPSFVAPGPVTQAITAALITGGGLDLRL